jgi:hypothetical protein
LLLIYRSSNSFHFKVLNIPSFSYVNVYSYQSEAQTISHIILSQRLDWFDFSIQRDEILTFNQ